jgi:hypothetical protein
VLQFRLLGLLGGVRHRFLVPVLGRCRTAPGFGSTRGTGRRLCSIRRRLPPGRPPTRFGRSTCVPTSATVVATTRLPRLAGTCVTACLSCSPSSVCPAQAPPTATTNRPACTAACTTACTAACTLCEPLDDLITHRLPYLLHGLTATRPIVTLRCFTGTIPPLHESLDRPIAQHLL